MKHYEYLLYNFHYSKSIATLIGREKDLYCNGILESFPNGRKQFFIKNPKTKGFRRFRLLRERTSYYLFESDDNIKCMIIKTTNKY